MKKIYPLVAVLLLMTLAVSLVTSCSPKETSRLKVATSTSLLEYIVSQVGGEHVEVFNMVPPNQHPGNFDARPGDIQYLSGADLFLLHGWPGEGYADKLIESAANPDLQVVKANVDGNWMIPSVQSTAVDRVAAVLGETDESNSADYEKAAGVYKERIQSVETTIKSQLAQAGVSSVKVIASARQADFLQWAGFDVVATFVNAQALTPQTVKDLIDQGRASGVTLVVNNLQDGQDAGKAVALELGAANLNLSNFPGGFDDTETWEKAIGYNIDTLLNALKQGN